VITKEKRLGRGLSALLGDAPEKSDEKSALREAPIEQLVPNPLQPRKRFSEAELQELSQSIQEKGILQPILVRPSNGGYQIVAGERRWRAAQLARQHNVPVLVRELDDAEVLQIAIIENIQREELNPVEEARAYRRLQDEFGQKQEEVAKLVGKSRSHVANLMRLLSLPDAVLSLVEDSKISAGHARTLVGADDPVALARIIVRKGLNVRQAEALQKRGKTGLSAKQPSVTKDADTRALERRLGERLGLKVDIRHYPSGRGKMIINYKSLDQLDEVCDCLSGATD